MPLPSKSKPMALVNSPLPSERNSTLPLPPAAFDQASITKGSFTATQATVCTPFFLKASAFSRNPGRCLRWQVGVKAPGTANSTTFLPSNTSDVLNFSMPSDPSTRKVASGRRSPIPILMVTSGRLLLEFARTIPAKAATAKAACFSCRWLLDRDARFAGAFVRHEGQSQRLAPDRFRLGRRCEADHEALLAVLRRPERLRHRDELSLRTLDEEIGTGGTVSEIRIDDKLGLGAIELGLDAAKGRQLARLGRLGHEIDETREQWIVHLPCRTRRKLDAEIRLVRDAQRLADTKVDIELELDRLVPAFRRDHHWEHHFVLIADRGSARVGKAMRRRIEHLGAPQILRSRPIEARRHAGVAWHSPIGLPTWLETNLDAGDQLVVAHAGNAAAHQPHLRIAFPDPGRFAGRGGEARAGKHHAYRGETACEQANGLH